VVTELESITRCSNVQALREPKVPPPELRPQIAQIDQQLAEAKARMIAGQYLPALTTSVAASKQAKELDDGAMEAEAENSRGAALLGAGNSEDAVATLSAAVWSAEAARRDDLVIKGAIAVAMLTSEALGKPAEAKLWLALGKAAWKRAGFEHDLSPELYKAEALIAADLGDIPGAIKAQETSFNSIKQLYGDSSILAGNEALFASTLVRGYEYTRAIPHFQHAITVREAIVGSDNGDVALMISNLAVCYQFTNDPRAKETFERAKNIRERMFGVDSPVLVPTLDNYAVFLKQQGDFSAALEMIERAQRLADVFPGKDQYSYHVVATDHADVLRAAGRIAEARSLYEDTLALEAKTHSTALPTTQTSRAELALAEKAWSDAEAYAEKAVAGFEAAGGAENPELWRPLTALGRAKIGLGKKADARPLLEHAMAIGQRVHLPDALIAPTREALSKL
jgi:tetratricopeptide (TPR) repeat protein